MKSPDSRDTRTRVLSCGILKAELEALPAPLVERLDIVFLDSILHMRPKDLESDLRRLLDLPPDGPVLLVFGDCSPGMRELSLGPGRVRISGVNCCEIVLGRERYRDLRRRETFLFMPEWTARWREVFGAELGFQSIDAARGFMTDSMQSLAYVDTGVVPVPVPTLREIEDFFGMPVRIEHAGIGLLEKAVLEALKILDAQELNLTEGDFGRGRGGHPK